MRIIVTGGRDHGAVATVARTLTAYALNGPHTLVHGACKVLKEDGSLYPLSPGAPPGADRSAHYIALALGWEVEPHPAHWRTGHNAGPIRNQQMVDLGADLCIAFAGGKGTAHMIRCAQRAGIPVHQPERTP